MNLTIALWICAAAALLAWLALDIRARWMGRRTPDLPVCGRWYVDPLDHDGANNPVYVVTLWGDDYMHPVCQPCMEAIMADPTGYREWAVIEGPTGTEDEWLAETDRLRDPTRSVWSPFPVRAEQ